LPLRRSLLRKRAKPLFLGAPLLLDLRVLLALDFPLSGVEAVERHFAAQTLLFEQVGLQTPKAATFALKGPQRQEASDIGHVERAVRRGKWSVEIEPQ